MLELQLDLFSDICVRPEHRWIHMVQLAQFGAEEVPRDDYKRLLIEAVEIPARWLPSPPPDLLDAEIRAIAGR